MSDTDTKENLTEGLTWAGKLFFTTLAANLSSDNPRKLPMNIKGTPEQIIALAEVIQSNKAFQDELKKPDATIESVYQALQQQGMTKEKFKSIFGQDFPL